MLILRDTKPLLAEQGRVLQAVCQAVSRDWRLDWRVAMRNLLRSSLGHRNGPSLKGPSASVIKWVDSPRERQWATPQKSRHALGQSDAGPPGIGHERGQRFQRGGSPNCSPLPQSPRCPPIANPLGTELSRLRKSLRYYSRTS